MEVERPEKNAGLFVEKWFRINFQQIEVEVSCLLPPQIALLVQEMWNHVACCV